MDGVAGAVVGHALERLDQPFVHQLAALAPQQYAADLGKHPSGFGDADEICIIFGGVGDEVDAVGFTVQRPLYNQRGTKNGNVVAGKQARRLHRGIHGYLFLDDHDLGKSEVSSRQAIGLRVAFSDTPNRHDETPA